MSSMDVPFNTYEEVKDDLKDNEFNMNHVTFLLVNTDENPDMDIDMNITDKNGNNAILYVVQNYNSEGAMPLIERIIGAGVNPELKNNAGISAKDFIMEHGSNRMKSLLYFANMIRIVNQRIALNITKTVDFSDPITGDEKMIHVEDYIRNPDNIVFIYGEGNYFFTKRSIIKEQYNSALVYGCKRAMHGLAVTEEDIYTSPKLYNLHQIGLIGPHQYCDIKYILGNPAHQLYAIVNLELKYDAFAAGEIVGQPDPDVTSRLHCQDGYESKTSYAIPAFPSTKDNPSTVMMGGKQRTINNYKRKHKHSQHVRKTRKNAIRYRGKKQTKKQTRKYKNHTFKK